MTDSRTIQGDYIFKVSESPNGTFWITLEPRVQAQELANVDIGFELTPGAGIHLAESVAAYLNENLPTVTFTFHRGARISA